MLFKQTYLPILLLISLSLPCISFALTEAEQAQINFIKTTIAETDKATLEALNESLQMIESAKTVRMQKMSHGRIVTRTRLYCVMGSAANGVKGAIAGCVDEKGKLYTLMGGGVGVAVGAKASLLVGYVDSTGDDIRGTYGGMGFAASGIESKLLQTLLKIRSGWGLEWIYLPYADRSPDDGLMLIGPSIGLMAELPSLQMLVLQ